MYIACPKCDWRPSGDHRWRCSCGHIWNTFQTHGVCPKCGRRWKTTQCTVPSQGGCRQWSDHEEWYHEDEGLTVEEYLKQHRPIPIPVTND
jgi:hypothetical protein